MNILHKKFYSFIPIITETTNIEMLKSYVSCASSGIQLLNTFETLGPKLEVLLSSFCGTKITLE